jgi:hypothetical protein
MADVIPKSTKTDPRNGLYLGVCNPGVIKRRRAIKQKKYKSPMYRLRQTKNQAT